MYVFDRGYVDHKRFDTFTTTASFSFADSRKMQLSLSWMNLHFQKEVLYLLTKWSISDQGESDRERFLNCRRFG
jgi:transposase